MQHPYTVDADGSRVTVGVVDPPSGDPRVILSSGGSLSESVFLTLEGAEQISDALAFAVRELRKRGGSA